MTRSARNGRDSDEEIEADDGGTAAPQFVQAFGRGLAVLSAFDFEHPQLTLSDAARRAGVTRAAARRLLHTLVQLGYVRTDGRYFSLRPKVLELGYAYLSALSLPEAALPHLEILAERVHESAYMSVLDGHETVCVANVPIRRIWQTSISVGTRMPAYATAAGRVMLADKDDTEIDAFLSEVELVAVTPHTTADPERLRAELEKVRKQEYALVDHELEEGLRTVGVPVRSRDRVVAALSFSTLTGRIPPSEAVEEMLPPLRAAAEAVEEDLRSLERARVIR
ncbi:MAG TPA: IclR family transcriptional regulator C-terminal domain-containing protein [Capillimicrobium sp.]|nr:IclR family transcriptional regulator C-terminal domain-containing protein [Capillimicrobium sp.]